MAPSAAGRRGSKEAFWQRHIQAQRKSGQSVRAYCQKRGLKEATFYWWRAALARREASTPTPAFVPVRVVSDPRRAPGDCDSAPVATGSSASIEIVLPGGRQIRICGPVDQQQLADVLWALEAASC